MPKPRIRQNTLYIVDMTGNISYGPVSSQRMYERFSDGRLPGLLNTDLLQFLFKGMTKIYIGGGSHDLRDDNGLRYKARTVTNNNKGVEFRPSNQRGQGRAEDDQAAMQDRRDVDFFIVVDVRESPIYKIFMVPNATIGAQMKFTVGQIDRLVATFPVTPLIY